MIIMLWWLYINIYIKQLLNKVEPQTLASADNTNLCLNYFIIVLLFICMYIGLDQVIFLLCTQDLSFEEAIWYKPHIIIYDVCVLYVYVVFKLTKCLKLFAEANWPAQLPAVPVNLPQPSNNVKIQAIVSPNMLLLSFH